MTELYGNSVLFLRIRPGALDEAMAEPYVEPPRPPLDLVRVPGVDNITVNSTPQLPPVLGEVKKVPPNDNRTNDDTTPTSPPSVASGLRRAVRAAALSEERVQAGGWHSRKGASEWKFAIRRKAAWHPEDAYLIFILSVGSPMTWKSSM